MFELGLVQKLGTTILSLPSNPPMNFALLGLVEWMEEDCQQSNNPYKARQWISGWRCEDDEALFGLMGFSAGFCLGSPLIMH